MGGTINPERRKAGNPALNERQNGLSLRFAYMFRDHPIP